MSTSQSQSQSHTTQTTQATQTRYDAVGTPAIEILDYISFLNRVVAISCESGSPSCRSERKYSYVVEKIVVKSANNNKKKSPQTLVFEFVLTPVKQRHPDFDTLYLSQSELRELFV